MPSNHDLDALAEMANAADVACLSRYCHLRAKGLRKEAMRALADFLDGATELASIDRRAFVLALTEHRKAFSDPHLCCPEPLVMRLILPTLKEWLQADPVSATAHFLLGTYSFGIATAAVGETPMECFRKAIALDPKHQGARTAFVDLVSNWVSYAQHELPFGYIGPAEEDVMALQEALFVLRGIDKTPQRSEAEDELRSMLGQAERWLASRA
ncbi:hypothetical protein ACWIGM_11295 [Bosea sp. NPDC055332]